MEERAAGMRRGNDFSAITPIEKIAQVNDGKEPRVRLHAFQKIGLVSHGGALWLN